MREQKKNHRQEIYAEGTMGALQNAQSEGGLPGTHSGDRARILDAIALEIDTARDDDRAKLWSVVRTMGEGLASQA